jgi:hypothetical protein
LRGYMESFLQSKQVTPCSINRETCDAIINPIPIAFFLIASYIYI